MSDINIRIEGCAGRITLNRPEALNALTYPMILEMEAALDSWADDNDVKMVIIDATGEKAFCAGGDIAEMYRTANGGNYEYGRRFWRDEYRLNAKIFNFPKPYVAFMQGFIMGGGVGVACHGSHRIVGTSSRISMPECCIGLIPDVGGTLLLARAPGRLGEYLGTTGVRMKSGDAIRAEFADYFIDEATWPDLIAELEQSGDWSAIDRAAGPAPASHFDQTQIDTCFAGETAADILRALPDNDWGQRTEEVLRGNCPISVACTVELIHRVRGRDSITFALAQEFRFTARSASHGDFIEGIRAAVIDKDKQPRWSHATIEDVSASEVSRMLMPLGDKELEFGGST